MDQEEPEKIKIGRFYPYDHYNDHQFRRDPPARKERKANVDPKVNRDRPDWTRLVR